MSDTITETATIAMLTARLEVAEDAMSNTARAVIRVADRVAGLEKDSMHALACAQMLAGQVKALKASASTSMESHNALSSRVGAIENDSLPTLAQAIQDICGLMSKGAK